MVSSKLSAQYSLLASVLGVLGAPLLIGPALAQAPPSVNAPDLQIAQSLPPLPVQGANLPPVSVTSGAGASTVAQRYMVYVNGNSPLLLDQVRLIQPDAFRQQHGGRTVIQAGLYDSEQNARTQIQRLSNVGIRAELTSVQRALATPPITGYAPNSAVPIPVTSVPNGSVAFGQSSNGALPPPPNALAQNQSRGRSSAYYVVLPAGHQTVAALGSQVVNFGVSSSLVQTRTAPFGPHVAVGPFSSRGDAEEWNRYLEGFGLDSRVFYQR